MNRYVGLESRAFEEREAVRMRKPAPGGLVPRYSSSMLRRGSTSSIGLIALCALAQLAVVSSHLWHSHGHHTGETGQEADACCSHEHAPPPADAPAPSDEHPECEICLALASVTLDLPGAAPGIETQQAAGEIAIAFESRSHAASISRPHARGPPARRLTA